MIPLVLDWIDLDDVKLRPARGVRAGGALPDDVTFGNIGMMLVRLSRPLPGPIPLT